jgi:plastocyanin
VRRLIALAVLAGAALPASASAAAFGVSAQPSNSFSPSALTIAPGDTVNFSNNGGFHNVKFDDGSFKQPMSPDPSPWQVSRTFPDAGRFAYYCEQHGGPNGVGMSGVITVKSGGAGGGGPTATPPPKVTSLKVKRASRGVIRVRLRASSASTAKVTLSRRSRGRFRRLKSVKQKLRDTLTVSFKRRGGKALLPGRYRVTAQLTDDKGVKGPARSARITLR